MSTTKASRKSNLNRKFRQWLEAPVSVAPLAVFRMIFGALMLVSTLRFMALGWVDEHFVATRLRLGRGTAAPLDVCPARPDDRFCGRYHSGGFF